MDTNHNNYRMQKKQDGLRKRKKDLILHNIPEVVMYVLGSFIMLLLGFLFLLLYIGIFIISTLWYMRFVCTNCPHFENSKCPSGYSFVAQRLFKKGDIRRFSSEFKKHMGVVFPSWFVPPIAGIFLLTSSFSWGVLALLVMFIVNSFVILPIFSRKFGCQECDLKDQCPWMGKFGK